MGLFPQEGALLTYVTAGDQPLDELPDILETLAESGSDVIEIGLPFSDPIADGPVIQSASTRALERGTRLMDVLSAVRGFDKCPLVLMGYLNPLLNLGFDRYCQTVSGTAVAGTIVCDLVPEEAEAWVSASRSAGLSTIFLAAPTSDDARLSAVCREATGFVYAVSRTGVTGANDQSWSQAETLVGRLRPHTSLPVYVGFGIGTPTQVAEVCRFADGAVVGSALVALLHEKWGNGRGKGEVADFVSDLKRSACQNH